MERPYVILHNEVSADGRIDHLSVDLARFYELAGRWREDATLVGSDTVLGMEAEIEAEPGGGDQEDDRPAEASSAPLLVVVDGRGRVSRPAELRRLPYWRDIVVLTTTDAPRSYFELLRRNRIPFIARGRSRVDLAEALEQLLGDFEVKTLRVDSGGRLNGALLRAGLVDEVSLLIEPRLVGGSTSLGIYRAPDLGSADGVVDLDLLGVEAFADDVVWLRYRVIR